jgi:tetratricopeptide (TPR) repeat protein
MDTFQPQKLARTLTNQKGTLCPGTKTPGSTVEPTVDLPLSTPDGDVSDDALSASVVRAVRQKKYDRALYLLNQLIQRHPQEANYYSNRGLLHLWQKNYEAALADCNQAIKLEPGLDQAYNNRANCYAAMGLTVKALLDYERAVDLNPFNSRARINLGVTLRDLEEFDAALECLDEALLFYKMSAFIYAERGRTYHLRGDWNCAIADYRRAQTALGEEKTTPQHQRLQQRVQGWVDELLPGQRPEALN